jgi:putative hydrolase of the HAD superfamily
MGMRTVLVNPTRQDAAHIQYHTDDLAGFLDSVTA